MLVLAAIPNPFDPSQWVEQTIKGFVGLLFKGIAALLGAMLGWFDRVTEADLTRPWALDAYGRVLAVAAALGVLVLIVSSAAGAARRGPAGALAPLGRLLLAGLAMGFLRLGVEIGQQFSDALTVWLVPNFHGDVENVMATMTAWSATVPASALMAWWFLSALAFIAVFILAIQMFLLKFLILIMWVLIPFAAIFSIGQQGMTWLKRHAVVVAGIFLVKPAMALIISMLAGLLDPAAGATIDEGFTAVAGLGLAVFAPWIIIGMLAKSVPLLSRTSKAGDPVAGSRKAVATVTAPPDVVRSIRQRLDSHTGNQATQQKAWDKSRPLARDAALAAAGAVATGGAALPAAAASVGKNGAAKAGAVATKAVAVPTQQYLTAGGQVSREFGERSGLLVADKAGRVVDVGAHVPAEPAGLGPNERLAWRREHVSHDEPTPALPPVRRAPTPKENGQ